jgi:hypothetical protein
MNTALHFDLLPFRLEPFCLIAISPIGTNPYQCQALLARLRKILAIALMCNIMVSK